MRRSIFAILGFVAAAAIAGEKEFVTAYDRGDFDLAASQIESLDVSRPQISRRVGAMYYNGKGVVPDKERGKSLMIQSALSGDSVAALNMAKIYCEIEPDVAKSAWFLLLAEISGDGSVQADATRVRNVIGGEQEFKNCLAAFGKSFYESLKNRDKQLKELSGRLDAKEKELLECDTRAKNARDQFVRDLELLRVDSAKVKGELEAGLALAKREMEKMRLEVEASNSEAGSVGDKLRAAESKVADIATQLERTNHDDVVAQDKLKSKIAELESDCVAKDRQYSELLALYNEECEKYARLSEAFDRLCKDSWGKNSFKPVKNRRMVREEGGFLRGWNTFFCSICNFVRVGPAVKSVYSDVSGRTSEPYGCAVAAVSAPVIFCLEVVPTVCDIGNGLCDMITFGAYGDWLYDGELTDKWYRRDDTHFFPWLDR